MTSDRDAPIEAVIFDIGNVLLDWDPRHLYRKLFACEQEMEQFLSEAVTMRWILELDRGKPFERGVAELSARHPQWADQIEAYDSRWPETLQGAIAGTVRLMERLAARGTKLYALSNFSAEKYRETRPNYPFFEMFDGLVISGEEGVIKPEREIYERLLARFELSAPRCFFIDDNAANIAAARELGFSASLFEGAGKLEAELLSLGLL